MKGYLQLLLAVVVTALAAWLTVATAIHSNAGEIITIQDPMPGKDLPTPEGVYVGEESAEIAMTVLVNSAQLTTKVEVAE